MVGSLGNRMKAAKTRHLGAVTAATLAAVLSLAACGPATPGGTPSSSVTARVLTRGRTRSGDPGNRHRHASPVREAWRCRRVGSPGSAQLSRLFGRSVHRTVISPVTAPSSRVMSIRTGNSGR